MHSKLLYKLVSWGVLVQMHLRQLQKEVYQLPLITKVFFTNQANMKLSLEELDIMDAACVPTSFFLLICYHIQLFYRIKKFPTTTVQGTNRLCRQTWVKYMTKVCMETCTLHLEYLKARYPFTSLHHLFSTFDNFLYQSFPIS